MIEFIRNLFTHAPAQHPDEAEFPPRAVGKNAMLAAGYGKIRRFKIEGKVLKVCEGPDEILASGDCIKQAVSAEALKAAWERDMKIAFPMGADYNVEYYCTVTPLDDESDDDDDGDRDQALAVAAAVSATTMF